jgi:hypothetical protein
MTRWVDSHTLQARRRASLWAVAALLMLVALTGLAGCDREATTSSSVTPGDSSSTAEPPTTSSTQRPVSTVSAGWSAHLHWGETVTIGDGVRITVSAPRLDPKGAPVFDGSAVFYCVAEIANEGSQSFRYYQGWFEVYAAGGEKSCAGGIEGRLTTVSEPALGRGSVDPGQTVRGAIPLELPAEVVSKVDYLQLYQMWQGVTWVIQWSGGP